MNHSIADTQIQSYAGTSSSQDMLSFTDEHSPDDSDNDHVPYECLSVPDCPESDLPNDFEIDEEAQHAIHDKSVS